MTTTDLSNLLAALPAEALVPVGWVRARLASPLPVEAVGDLSCSAVAEALNRKSGTVRGWCARGEIVGAYLLNGREWRIPRASLRSYLDRQGEGLSPVEEASFDLGAWRKAGAAR